MAFKSSRFLLTSGADLQRTLDLSFNDFLSIILYFLNDVCYPAFSSYWAWCRIVASVSAPFAQILKLSVWLIEITDREFNLAQSSWARIILVWLIGGIGGVRVSTPLRAGYSGLGEVLLAIAQAGYGRVGLVD